MLRWLSSFALACLLCAPASADLDECYRSTCRIRAGGGSGSGCVYSVDERAVYVLTNYHVAGRTGSQVTCTFVARGYQSQALPGRVIWTSYSPNHHRDMAIVAIDISLFGNRVPKAIPLAREGYRLQAGQTITTVGSPRAEWQSARVGHVDDVRNDVVVFTPAAIPGQSGSAIFDEGGERIVGLIAWSDGGHGLAMTSEEIWRAARGEAPTLYRFQSVAPAALEEETQCPGGVCPTPQMPIPRPQQPGGGGGFNPFPGLPNDPPIAPRPTDPVAPVPPPEASPSAGCKCDPSELRELTIRVQRIEGSLESAAKSQELLAKHLDEIAKTVKETQLAAQRQVVEIQRLDSRLTLLEKRPAGEKQSGQFRIKFEVDPKTGTMRPIE